MRVTFPRLPDHERAYAVVERDDGTVYRLYGGPAGRPLPHDIRRLVVERELHIRDGIWGAIAAGLVLDSLVADSSALDSSAFDSSALDSSAFPRMRRAEALASLVEGVAGLDHPSASQIKALAAARLSADADLDPAAIATAAQALQVEAARWARLRVGEELSYDWPRTPLAARRRARAVKPRLVRHACRPKG